jgi:hypothetical protein
MTSGSQNTNQIFVKDSNTFRDSIIADLQSSHAMNEEDSKTLDAFKPEKININPLLASSGN